MPVIVYKSMRGLIEFNADEMTTPIGRLLMIPTFLFLCFICILNYYWYFLILKGIYRMITHNTT